MRILLAILLAFTVGISTVSAWYVDEGTLYYDGVPIQWPEDEQAQKELLESLDTYGPPPPPPGYIAPVVSVPITYKNQDSSPAIQVEYDWTNQDYWIWT